MPGAVKRMDSARERSGGGERERCARQAVTAVVFVDGDRGAAQVAGLSVLERLLVAARRAGCMRIVVVGFTGGWRFRRLRALGIEPEAVEECPRIEGPVLVLEAGLLVLAGDLRRLVEGGGRLVGGDGDFLPAGRVDGVPAGMRLGGETWTGLTPVRAEAVAVMADTVERARCAEKMLWGSLRSASDGWVDRVFNRPLGRPLSQVLVFTEVTPNQVSVAAIVMGVVAAGLFTVGRWEAAVWGAVLLQLSAVVDCIDGDLARVMFKESRLGKWLDLVGDQVVHVGLFVGIAVGLQRAGSAAPVGALGLSAAVGAVIAFLVVLRGLLDPRRIGGGGFQRLVDATTNRDFSVLLLALALAGKLEWFLWLAGIGVHVFWLVALVLQRPARRRRVASAAAEAGGSS